MLKKLRNVHHAQIKKIMKVIHKMKLSSILLILSIILSMLGGYSDMTGHRVFGLSREHYWSDAIYMGVLAIAIHILWHK